MLAAFAASLGGLFTILSKVARVMVRASAAMAGLTAFAARLCGPFPVIGEIPGTVLSAGMAGS